MTSPSASPHFIAPMAQTSHRPKPRIDLSIQACDICRKRKVKCLLAGLQTGATAARCQRCERLNLSCTFLSPSKTRGPKKRPEIGNEATNEPVSRTTYWSDDICDRGLFQEIMNDYLDYLYPMVPVVHLPSFKKALCEEQDEGFSALTVSIAALVVATMAGRFQTYRNHETPLRFSSRKEMVHFCYQKKFAISYLFYAAFLQLGDHNWSRMLSVEAFHVLGERLSYLDPVTLHSINPEDLMPLDVPDESIFENEVLVPPDSTLCLEIGFSTHSRVFWAAIRPPCPAAQAKEPCPCTLAHKPLIRISYFKERLECLKHLLDEIPDVLRPWDLDNSHNKDFAVQNLNLLHTQFAAMRVNLHVTHLWLQSLIMDQLEAAQTHQQDQGWSAEAFDHREMWKDREEICHRLFFILYNVPQICLEANGLHLANKVRDISASLLACPFGPDDPISKRVREYVGQSTEILSRLDQSESLNTMHLQTWVDTDRIGNASG
ncbi:beta-glucosidase [Penicillium herquei]|nr:beta-glucosidase [Penicillium herquei]